MRKIIAAFDGLKYSDSTAAYSIWFAGQLAGKLTGVFLEDTTYHSFKLVDISDEDVGYEQNLAYRMEVDKADRSYAVRLFNEACLEAGVPAIVHRHTDIPIRDLLRETLFSDLLIIQNNETFRHYSEAAPTNFIVQLLESSECSVLLVPNYFRVPERIVFLYDGTPQSVFAIKHFTYLLGRLKLPIQVLSDVSYKEEKELPKRPLFLEWLQHHYNRFDYKVLQGKAEEEIVDELKSELKHCIVVMGAYGRGFISRVIHSSLADIVVKKLNLPIFVSHK